LFDHSQAPIYSNLAALKFHSEIALRTIQKMQSGAAHYPAWFKAEYTRRHGDWSWYFMEQNCPADQNQRQARMNNDPPMIITFARNYNLLMHEDASAFLRYSS
jgi:hypothetical protein